MTDYRLLAGQCELHTSPRCAGGYSEIPESRPLGTGGTKFLPCRFVGRVEFAGFEVEAVFGHAASACEVIRGRGRREISPKVDLFGQVRPICAAGRH